MTDIDELLRKAHETENREICDRIREAVQMEHISDVTTTVEFALPIPLRLMVRGAEREITEIKASVATYPNPKGPEDEEPYLSVQGWAYQITKDGKRSKRDAPYWTHLPDDLAVYLVGLGKNANVS